MRTFKYGFMILVVLFLVVPVASAQNVSVTEVVTGVRSSGCNAGQLAINSTLTTSAAGTYNFEILVVAGDRIYTQDFGTDTLGVGSTNYYNVADAINEGGRVNAAFPLPQNVVVRFTLNTYDLSNKLLSSVTAYVDSCNSGKLINSPTTNGLMFTDGRLNQDAFQAASIYCRSWGFDVFFKGGSFSVFTDEINAVGVPTDAHALIKQVGDWQVYRMTSGWFYVQGPAINASKIYWVNWNACPATRWNSGEYNR